MRNLDYSEIGRLAKFYDMKRIKKLDRIHSFVKGYSTTVKIRGGLPKIIIDTASRILRNDTMYDWLLQKGHEYGIHNPK